MKKQKIINFIQTRPGFLTLLVACFWMKYIFAAYCDFNLGLTDPYQHFIMWLSPVGAAIILISFGFYIPKPLISYIAMLILTLPILLYFLQISFITGNFQIF